jgi:hypothetical protein
MGVGQDDAHRLTGELIREITDDVIGAVGEPAVPVGVGIVRQVEMIGGHSPVPGSNPGRQNAVADDAWLHGLSGQEMFPGTGQERASARRVAGCGYPPGA